MVEYGSNVTLECEFPVERELDLNSLVVYWEMENKKIIQLVNGIEDSTVQHSSYQQRAQLLKDQLLLGKAALQIIDVKLEDAGVYCCLISYGGADYKRITLKVHAPYHKINQRVSVDPLTLEHELTCQAEGYPEAEVIWRSSDHQVLSGKTIITNSKEGKLLNVTSILKVNTTANENFTCTFHRPGYKENNTETLIIPEQALLVNKRTHWIILGAVLLFLAVSTVILHLKRKDMKIMDVESCFNRNANSKKNEPQFEET